MQKKKSWHDNQKIAQDRQKIGLEKSEVKSEYGGWNRSAHFRNRRRPQ